jgi:hypothetical protein
VCSFPVHGEVLVNRQKITVFSDGRQLVTGAFVSQWTNTDNDETIVTNAPGPLTFTPNDDGTTSLVGTGQNVYFFFPGDLGPGEPGALLLLDGHTSEQFDATGALVQGSFTHSGSAVDLCAALS